MGLFNRISGTGRTDDRTSKTTVDPASSIGPSDSGYGAVSITREFANSRVADAPQAIRVRPVKEHEGIPTAVEFLEALHDVRVEKHVGRANTNVSVPHAFEIRYSGERVNFQFVPGEHSWQHTLERQLADKYPDAQIEMADAGLLSISEGDYVAGATLSLDRYTLFPIRHLDLEGFQRDPFGSITSEMVGTSVDGVADADVVVQIMFRPAMRNWTDGVNSRRTVDTIAKELEMPKTKRGGILKQKYTVDPSKKDKRAAKIVREQRGKKGWELNIRVLAASADPDVARDRVEKAAGMFRNYYESSTEQRFVPEPLAGTQLLEMVDNAYSRAFVPTNIVKSQEETAGLVHVPNAEINQQNVEWALSRPGEGIPPGTPRFDFDAHGVSTASDAEKQLAMVDETGPGDPFFLGFGSKNGIEAGIDEDKLNAHAFVGGGTRKGKTTCTTNFVSQAMGRDYGALVIMLGKQDDDENVIAEWPTDRPEEDFVFIDTGSEFDQKVRLNLLSIPDRLEPGTPEHSSYVEALSEDMAAAFAQAGGSDNYWGALMGRVLNTVIHGMAKSDHESTLIDAAACVSAQHGLEQFSQWMSDEQIHFVMEAAERLTEKEDTDLEPLAGRMDKLLFNATLRQLMSARNPTVDVQEIVDEGKVAVLRLDPSLGDSERQFLTTPYVRRFYTAKKMSDNDDPFFCVWDEFDKAVSSESNVDQMLSEAGGYDFWFWLACQAPSHQLPDQLTDAIASQVETFISFGTGDKDARYIAGQHTIEPDDLSHLGRYKFYMRTHDEHDDFTHSYKVNAFPPIREVREQAGHPVTSIEDVKRMKATSVDRYGDAVETDEEIKQTSPFFGGSTTEDEDTTGFEVTDEVRAQTCKAVFDESIRQESADGWVRSDLAADRIRRYLPDDAPLGTTAKLWGNLLEYIPESHIDREERDNAIYLRCTDEGKLPIFAQGSSQNAAGPLHRKTVKKIYRPLTELGFVYEIPTQHGESMPDGVARLDDVDILQFGDDATPKEIHEAYDTFTSDHEYALLNRLSDGEDVHIQVEESTGDTAPAQTVINLALALNQGKRCLFVARTEEIARKVWDHLNEEPRGMRTTSQEGYHRYYNANDEVLRVGGNAVYRPAGASQTKWLYDYRTAEVVLRDSDDEEHARFDSPEDVFNDPTLYPAVEGHIEDPDEWDRVKPPIIPDVLFNDGLDSDRWDIFVPTDDSLSLYEDGTLTPLEDITDVDPDPEPTSTGPSMRLEDI